MTNEDKRIVKKGIKRQYFPNDQGLFNVKDLKKRKKGIKDIEDQYLERIQTAAINDNRVVSSGNKMVIGNHGMLLSNASNKNQVRTPSRASVIASRFQQKRNLMRDSIHFADPEMAGMSIEYYARGVSDIKQGGLTAPTSDPYRNKA